jgi:tocopherol cyclase
MTPEAAMYLLWKIWNPSLFQGKYKTRHYFEGWYIKLISEDQQHVVAVIPGISYGARRQDHHAFVQIIDGISGHSHYIRYNADDFVFSEDLFEVYIGNNFFSASLMDLNIQTDEIKLQGMLSFNHIIPFPSTMTNPGIMGPFSFIPFLECYHGVVNIHHEIAGTLMVNDSPVNFNGGYGYIEKDWGKSFPEAWIWLQCNHFDKTGVSFMFSAAEIPLFGKSFVGHISFIKIDNRFYRFATYTGAKIVDLKIDANSLSVSLKDRQHTLEISARSSKSGWLRAPKNGLMDREILESINADVSVKLTDFQNNIIFEGLGTQAGFEQTDAQIFLNRIAGSVRRQDRRKRKNDRRSSQSDRRSLDQ